ncbi:MAG: hypothetical protein J2P20_18125, partial [Pseudonocardia sp.]|nr:hypothetical protein [Pseudonocardia sp.]
MADSSQPSGAFTASASEPPEPRLSQDRTDQIVETVARLRAAYIGGRGRELQWRRDQLAALERLLTERESEIAEA